MDSRADVITSQLARVTDVSIVLWIDAPPLLCR